MAKAVPHPYNAAWEVGQSSRERDEVRLGGTVDPKEAPIHCAEDNRPAWGNNTSAEEHIAAARADLSQAASLSDADTTFQIVDGGRLIQAL